MYTKRGDDANMRGRRFRGTWRSARLALPQGAHKHASFFDRFSALFFGIRRLRCHPRRFSLCTCTSSGDSATRRALIDPRHVRGSLFLRPRLFLRTLALVRARWEALEGLDTRLDPGNATYGGNRTIVSTASRVRVILGAFFVASRVRKVGRSSSSESLSI